MSFHPNDVQRRGQVAAVFFVVVFAVLLGAFFRTQVLQYAQYELQSEENRLREVPLPAPRGTIYDRNGVVIAENLPGYSVSLLSPGTDSLRAALRRLAAAIPLSPEQQDLAIRRFRRAPNRPAVILSDATFEQVSVLEERRPEFPGLIIQASPKRHYPDGVAVSAFMGYVGEITEAELTQPAFKGYKAGQQVGKAGLERQYESRLHGREGMRFVEVDARGRVVREAGARPELAAEPSEPLYTNVDIALQRELVRLFGDSLIGGAIAIDPASGEVLAMHSAPTFDPNRFVGGIPAEYWRQLNTDPRRPLFNKVIQGRYPPASTWKLATSALAMEHGLATLDTRMPVPCTGGFQYGNRYFRCWEKQGHGNVTLAQAIAVSCDVYFYQLGLKLGLSRLIAGGVQLKFREKTGIDLPDEQASRFPYAIDYYNKRYGARGWSNAVVLNLSIGQGENDQTVVNMARFYAALATGGQAPRPEIVRRNPERSVVMSLTAAQLDGLRRAMAGVVSAGGTAASARIADVTLAGKTGTAQNAQDPKNDHAWFVGFAPMEEPKIVVAVMLEFGGHGYRAARIASKVIESYLKRPTTVLPRQEAE
ncbi:MAG: penicillin-binding protein 2 [Gemmatimonadota bacterium]|jgi:penicillin-binding protein 2|nr:penicillin-binding protein 2 [Gemmatimonadota bacterium]